MRSGGRDESGPLAKRRKTAWIYSGADKFSRARGGRRAAAWFSRPCFLLDDIDSVPYVSAAAPGCSSYLLSF